jgi:hypothetical protein
MSSFITVIEKRQKKKNIGKVLWVEDVWLEFNPSLPTIISILDENINFISNLRS